MLLVSLFDESILFIIATSVLMVTLIAAYLVLKKTKSMRLALYTTLISPLVTLILVVLIPIINTDSSFWVDLAQIIIALLGAIASVLIYAITVVMLAILKKIL